MHKIDRHTGSLTFFITLMLSLSACVGEADRIEIIGEHPLDDIPVGCTAERVSLDRWEVRCADAHLVEASDMDVVEDPDRAVMPDQDAPDLEGLPDLNVMEDAEIIDEGLSPLQDAEVIDFEVQDGGLTPSCDPPLALTSETDVALALSLVSIQASGGSGAWRFELAENQSGGLINPNTGAYLAGEQSGTVDRVVLTDAQCEGEATLEIGVVEGMNVKPRSPIVQRGDQLQIEVEGGSGTSTLRLIHSESGGAVLGDLSYATGAQLGTDLLEVLDVHTGERVSITINVRSSAPIRISPALTAFPIGSYAQLNPQGGSGHYDLNVMPPLIADGLTLTAEVPTSQRVAVVDHFTGRSTFVEIQAVESVRADVPPQNDHFLSTIMIADHDLDGDGIRDAVIGQAQADVMGLNSGGIFVFLSGDAENTLYPSSPSQVFSSRARRAEVGRSFILVDLTGDGRVDLLYGSRGEDLVHRDGGALFLHAGLEEGGFEDEPTQTFNAIQTDDHLGASLSACDVNGDGWIDIVGGAVLYEDRRQDPINWNEGGVYLFLGGPEGFPSTADQIIRGRYYDQEVGGMNYPHFNYAYDLTTGDWNGDGLCDVAVSSLTWLFGGVGQVQIHAGRAADDMGLGGVSANPVVIIESDEERDQNNNLGRQLTSGELTGDGIDELVIGQYASDRVGNNNGAAHVFYGGGAISWTEENINHPRWVSPYTAEWTMEGNNWDHLSGVLSVIDYDGLPPQDLLVGGWYMDGVNGWDTGVIRVYLGAETGLSETEVITVHGPESAFQLFEGVAYLGDIDADGHGEWIARSNRGGGSHYHLGQTFLLTAHLEGTGNEDSVGGGDPVGGVEYRGTAMSLDEEWSMDLVRLNLPLQSAGAQFGYSVAWVGDFDGDGFEDAVVTASHASYTGATPAQGLINSGGLWLFRGQADGGMDEGQHMDKFVNFSDWDHVKGVSSAGDFNGDGWADFAVVIGNDERPATWTEAHWLNGAEDSCTALGYDQGGIYVFLGGPSADLTPDFAYYSDVGGLLPEAIEGGFDFNGDGFHDLAIGAIRRSSPDGGKGSVDLVFGRPLEPTLQEWQGPVARPMQVICSVDEQRFGGAQDEHYGYVLKGVSDLNHDGCDEIAVGARLSHVNGEPYQGAVYVYFGHGGQGCLTGPEGFVIESGERYIQLGTSIDAADLDGDGLDEIAVGAPYARVDGIGFGGAWVLPGALLSRSQRVSLSSLRQSSGSQRAEGQVWFNSASEEQRWFVSGSSQSSEAGRGVALLPSRDGSLGGVALGEVMGNSHGVSGLGMVRVFQLSEEGGFEPSPIAELWGESARPESRLSEGALRASPYTPRLIVGAREGGGVGIDHGSAYVIDLSAVLD